MGQKTHPYAFRIGIVNDWKSRWFSHKDYKKLVNQDYKIREFLSSQLIKVRFFFASSKLSFSGNPTN